MNELDFGNSAGLRPLKEKFDGHVLTVFIPAGGGECPQLRIECKSVDIEHSPCTAEMCALEDLWKHDWWDVTRAAGEIELCKLSARIDWSDSEEPWIDLEP